MNNRRTGKIARLPQQQRDHINQMLNDGSPYEAILRELTKAGHQGITRKNIQHWKDGGYQEWLRAKERRERVDAVLNKNKALLLQAASSGTQTDLVDYSATMLSLTQIFHTLLAFDEELLKQRLAEHPERYFDLILAQSRLLKNKHTIEHKIRDEAAAKKHAPVWERIMEELSHPISNTSVAREYSQDHHDEAEDDASSPGAETHTTTTTDKEPPPTINDQRPAANDK